MRTLSLLAAGAAALALTATAAIPAAAQSGTVKITPLGSHAGEFCPYDRALILEDPDGTRLLYDAGRTVAGADDPRLGEIDAVLVSHVHGDHVGDRRLPKPDAGTCSKPDATVAATPNSNSVDIAVAKGAKMILGSEMPKFFQGKFEKLGANPKDVQLVRFGGSKTVGGVTVTTVPAVHSNGLAGSFIEGELGKHLNDAGLTAYVGPPTGYVLTFTNGLVVYLSGDTGVTAEQEVVVGRQYNAKLAVMNIGDTYTTGPTEAAYVVNELIKPASVIASHANEVATEGGELIAGTKTETFMKATSVPVHLPLSGRTMAFDGGGTCVEGC